jgi:hypothetical protein
VSVSNVSVRGALRANAGEVVKQVLPLGTIAADKAEVSANALKIGPAGLLIAWVVGDEHRQQAKLRRHHLERRRRHIAYIGPGSGHASTPTELDTEVELIGTSATALDFVQVGTRQADVLAQDRWLDRGP